MTTWGEAILMGIIFATGLMIFFIPMIFAADDPRNKDGQDE